MKNMALGMVELNEIFNIFGGGRGGGDGEKNIS